LGLRLELVAPSKDVGVDRVTLRGTRACDLEAVGALTIGDVTGATPVYAIDVTATVPVIGTLVCEVGDAGVVAEAGFAATP
jgi:hypothetical protein